MPPRCTFHGSSGSSSSRPPTGKVPPAQGVLLQEITAYFTAPREAVKYVVTPLSVVTVGAAAPADEAGMTEVVLEKPRKDTIFGVVLKDYEHPYVDKVEASGLAHGKHGEPSDRPGSVAVQGSGQRSWTAPPHTG